MACSYTLNGIQSLCKEGKGGVVEVYIANFSAVTPTVATPEEGVPANNVTFAEGDYDKFELYTFRRNSASLTSTLEVNENAGNIFTTEVTLDFLKQDADKRVKIAALLASPCRVIVKDANKTYHVLGVTYPVEASAATVETGTAVSDANHYNITLLDQDEALPFILSAAEAAKLESAMEDKRNA